MNYIHQNVVSKWFFNKGYTYLLFYNCMVRPKAVNKLTPSKSLVKYERPLYRGRDVKLCTDEVVRFFASNS